MSGSSLERSITFLARLLRIVFNTGAQGTAYILFLVLSVVRTHLPYNLNRRVLVWRHEHTTGGVRLPKPFDIYWLDLRVRILYSAFV